VERARQAERHAEHHRARERCGRHADAAADPRPGEGDAGKNHDADRGVLHARRVERVVVHVRAEHQIRDERSGRCDEADPQVLQHGDDARIGACLVGGGHDRGRAAGHHAQQRRRAPHRSTPGEQLGRSEAHDDRRPRYERQ
jgi:hypothetical protein